MKNVKESSLDLEYRLYGLVMYNISEIQKSIQFGHANDEYTEKYGKDKNYLKWRKRDKTYIILNGGTSNDGTKSHYGKPKQLGTMEQHLITLQNNNIKCAPFYEPDLNYALSAIVFLVPETVFNKEEYPDFDFREPDFKEPEDEYEKIRNSIYQKFVKSIGKEAAFLKIFLKQFRLA